MIGLVADVHGNLPALEAVLADAQGVERWLVAGDLVGHLPFPDEVVERVASLEAVCVLGNHDHALLEGLDIPGSRSGTLAIRDQRARARPETRAFLASLPLLWEEDGVVLVHGSPFAPLEERLFGLDDRMREWLGGRMLVVGHSHRQLAEGGLVNPGTAGLPTDGDPRAAYAVLDDEGGVELRRVAYDPAPCIERLAELGFDDAYANCLRTGRWLGPTVPA
jgi:putative phosphoesterase